jgi:alkylated DNA repair dioxygenase AlkB
MQTLFPVESIYPEGFSYFPDFLSIQEEDELLAAIKKVDLHVFNFQGFEAKRKVASFGYDYSFDKRSLTKGKQIPQEFDWLIKKTAVKIGIDPGLIAELLVIEYPVGSVINWHRDAPPFDLIAGISLFSDCRFRFRPQETSKQARNSILSLPVQKRSLYVMTGPSRSEWQHSISPVKQVRYSITLRTLKEKIT